MMEPLPSLTALRLFVTAARQSSLTRAAELLGVTQSAASRRIALLERELGAPLFERGRRGVSLTPQGEAYLAAVAPALQLITSATGQARAAAEAEPLKLRVYSTFAVKWLLPRLPQFQAAHPGIDVRLDTTVTPVAFERDPVDLAIQFGDGRWPDLDTQLLLPDRIEPVCSPAFAREHDLSDRTARLAGLRLLDSHYRRADWDDWAADAGLSLAGAVRMEFPSSLLTIQAAIEGLGLAMGQTRLLAAELEAGALTAPFARPLSRPAGYYLVAPRNRPEPRRARLFRRWISGLARET